MCDIYKLTLNLINAHLIEKQLFKKDASWEIRHSKLGGRGLFATRKINAGDIIFIDHHIIIGPRRNVDKLCVTCFNNKNLRQCSNNCGLLICSDGCEKSEMHFKECKKINEMKTEDTNLSSNIISCLTPIRALFLNENGLNLARCLTAHNDPMKSLEVNRLKNEFKFNISKDEESIMRTLCTILDANAYEVLAFEDVPTLRGLYPLSSLMNHCCTPNTMHVFDSEQYMIVKATAPINENEEIFTSYTRLIWGTMSRRYHLLRTKHFSCTCARCRDPTENKTYLNALLCKNCNDLLLPVNPLLSKSDWKCNLCKKQIPALEANFRSSAIASRIASLEDNVLEIINYCSGKLTSILPSSNQIFIELKYRIIWNLGHKEGFLLHELSDELLCEKETCCMYILDLLRKLKLGECKMKGLILFELYQCDQERKRRLTEINNNTVMNKDLLREACDIFKFDITAPLEIREMWRNNNISCNWKGSFFKKEID